ncbi:hypothetical protein FLACHUCJ7_00020 [Flavobacterium chungangense]|uniref:Uncharacterized protein n=1 Tax=Flavobacterium chungangense TaxID=554283 RepID=A0A6V6YLS4_9FLAO|nr:hypothetical protein FLACHUCJ7_00020 [Flavobacterium chungangense]
MAIETVAVRVPNADGSKVTTKVVLPKAFIGLVGCVVTVKSLALLPLMVTSGVPFRFKASAPVFSIVKVLAIVPEATSVEPKSLWSARVGVVLLLAIVVVLPVMLISGTQVALKASPVIVQPLPPVAID